jgi:glycosyltransferase involved in cell wall biosynthesis
MRTAYRTATIRFKHAKNDRASHKQRLTQTPKLSGDEDFGPELDILVLGPVPPPFGGISVHVSRLVPLLAEAGFRVGVLNHFDSADLPYVVGTLRRNPLRYFRLPRAFDARVVHYHHARWPHLLAVALGRRDSPACYIVTLHAGDVHQHFPQLISKVPFVARMTVWALRRFDKVVLVNPDVAPAIARHLDEGRVEIVPAFLTSEERGFQYEPAIEAFLSSGAVLTAAAYSVQFRPDGGELYGLDTAVEAFAQLACERDDLRLALFIAKRPAQVDMRARRHVRRLERQLDRAGVRGRVLIVFGQPLMPAFRRTTLFVRPTRAEGDAVSVREALGAGLPVVASDVVTRPEGVVPFLTGSANALADALRSTLNEASTAMDRADFSGSEERVRSFSDALVSLYRTALDSSASRRAT